MKRETKVIIGASIVVGALLAIPLLISKVRSGRDAELMARKPTESTLKFRDVTKGVTQIKVFFRVMEAGNPGNRIPANQKPNLVLTGDKVTRLVQALHFGKEVEPVPEYVPGSIELCTALEFCSESKKLADLRIGMGGGSGVGARWYAPLTYIGDSFILPESHNYLEREFNCRLNGR